MSFHCCFLQGACCLFVVGNQMWFTSAKVHNNFETAKLSLFILQEKTFLPLHCRTDSPGLHVQQVRCVNKNSMLLRNVSIDSACLLQGWLLFQVMKEKSV